MAYEKTLVSPNGREVIAHSPAEVNDLFAEGYTVKPTAVPSTRRRSTSATTTTTPAPAPSQTPSADEDSTTT